MHICPHCQKLGISSKPQPFNHRLADCRYCQQVSEVRTPRWTPLAIFVATALAILVVHTEMQAARYQSGWWIAATTIFWMASILYSFYLLIDSRTTYVKYEPKNPQPEEGKSWSPK